MGWSKFFKRFLPALIAAPLLAGLALGIIGFLVAGTEEFVNGAIWGFALGLISVPYTGFTIATGYWGDYSGRYGAAWIQEETEGENRRR